MTLMHLSPREFVEAVDRALSSDRLHHLDECESCRQHVAELRGLLQDAETLAGVPEPSPLFWEHFSRRVHAATVGQMRAAPRAWWRNGWRPLAAVAAVAGAVALVVVFRPAPAGPSAGPARVASAGAVAGPVLAADDASIALIADLAAELPPEELQQVARPTREATAAAIDQLTPEQCEVMVRLIKAQMDGTE
jgi:hypothetical protein